MTDSAEKPCLRPIGTERASRRVSASPLPSVPGISPLIGTGIEGICVTGNEFPNHRMGTFVGFVVSSVFDGCVFLTIVCLSCYSLTFSVFVTFTDSYFHFPWKVCKLVVPTWRRCLKLNHSVTSLIDSFFIFIQREPKLLEFGVTRIPQILHCQQAGRLLLQSLRMPRHLLSAAVTRCQAQMTSSLGLTRVTHFKHSWNASRSPAILVSFR